jgi:hypothetical protein
VQQTLIPNAQQKAFDAKQKVLALLQNQLYNVHPSKEISETLEKSYFSKKSDFFGFLFLEIFKKSDFFLSKSVVLFFIRRTLLNNGPF